MTTKSPYQRANRSSPEVALNAMPFTWFEPTPTASWSSGADDHIADHNGDNHVGIALRVDPVNGATGQIDFIDEMGQARSMGLEAGAILPTSVRAILNTSTATGIQVAVAIFA